MLCKNDADEDADADAEEEELDNLFIVEFNLFILSLKLDILLSNLLFSSFISLFLLIATIVSGIFKKKINM